MKNVDIQFYGERGIVNGILLDIGNDRKKLNDFFQSIRLFGDTELPWKNGVDSCKWIVEPDLADFGNPDLIAIIESNDQKFVLFIEAKLLSYSDSSYALPDNIEADHLKDNSSMLNVQLALRYRFMKALLQSPVCNNSLSPIVEKGSPYLDYKKSRNLQKPSVLKAIKEDLFCVQEEQYFFIALTNDKLEENTQWEPHNEHLPPLFHRDLQNNRHVNANIKEYLGLLTYQTLITQGIVCENEGFFGKAWEMMGMSIEKVSLPSAPDAMLEEAGRDEGSKSVSQHIRSIGIDTWNIECRFCAKEFENDSRLKLKKSAGSYSAKSPNGEVVMKLMLDTRSEYLQDRNLILGLYDNSRIRLDLAKPIQPFEGTVSRYNKEFLFFPFDVQDHEQCEKIKQLALLYMESWENDESES